MSQAQIKATREFNPPNVHLLMEKKKSSRLRQINFVILVVSAAGGTKVSLGQAVCQENHFARKCPLSSTSSKVSLLEEEDELPVFQVFKVSANQSSDSSLVTLKVPSGNFICFEIDTGAL